MNVALLTAVAATGLAGASADMLTCNACYAATKEIIQRTPILSRDALTEDKKMALYDSFPTFCSSFNFHAYTADVSSFSSACDTFIKASDKEALQESLVNGEGASAVCATPCEGIAEEARLTSYTAPPRDKSAKKPAAKNAPGKGTVDDPAYKEALKRKAKRDAKRKAKNAAGGEDEDL